MALRNDFIKLAFLLSLLFLLMKYPEPMGRIFSFVLVGFAEILAKQFIGSLNL